MRKRPHTIRAFLLAPLIVPILWSAHLGAFRGHGASEVLGEIGTVTLSSMPYIYGAALLVGVPVYLWIRRRSSVQWWHAMIVGMVLDAAVLPIAEPVVAHTVEFGAVLGLAAGALFWVLWRPRPNRALNPTSLRPAG